MRGAKKKKKEKKCMIGARFLGNAAHPRFLGFISESSLAVGQTSVFRAPEGRFFTIGFNHFAIELALKNKSFMENDGDERDTKKYKTHMGLTVIYQQSPYPSFLPCKQHQK
jgi:hypothetical protein